MFLIALSTVGIMLLYAVPGFILVKTKLVKEHGIAGFAALLMYVCQPCLTLYSFQKVEFSVDIVIGMAIMFGLSTLVMAVVMLTAFLVFRKKYEDARYRVASLSVAFGNYTFLGLPLIEAILPDYGAGAIYSSVFFISMSLLGWTVGCALLTGDPKACKPLQIVFNPATLALIVALPLFFLNVHLPDVLGGAVTLVGKMSTPLCMLVVGMRLGASALKEVFTGGLQYIAAAIKQIVVPLFALLVVYFLPLSVEMKLTFFALNCCPVAAVVLTFAEIFGSGQKSAAKTVLVSTISSIVTMPLMLMLAEAILL